MFCLFIHPSGAQHRAAACYVLQLLVLVLGPPGALGRSVGVVPPAVKEGAAPAFAAQVGQWRHIPVNKVVTADHLKIGGGKGERGSPRASGGTS